MKIMGNFSKSQKLYTIEAPDQKSQYATFLDDDSKDEDLMHPKFQIHISNRLKDSLFIWGEMTGWITFLTETIPTMMKAWN